MKFEENHCKEVKRAPDCLIYFLIKDSEVVYVGQTTKGLKRPFDHLEKDFDTVKYMECDAEKLDITEDMYISKYSPIYNKIINNRYSLMVARNKLRKIPGCHTLTIWDIRKLVSKFGIKLIVLNNGRTYISVNDFEVLFNYCTIKKEGYSGSI